MDLFVHEDGQNINPLRSSYSRLRPDEQAIGGNINRWTILREFSKSLELKNSSPPNYTDGDFNSKTPETNRLIMRLPKTLLLFSCALIVNYGLAQAQPKAPTKTPTTKKPAKQSEPQKRRTVRDYYLLLPDRYFLESPQENLRKRPMIVDVANDFIETYGEEGQPYFRTAVFRYRGDELFAVKRSTNEGYVLKFYRLKSGRLNDVTAQVWKFKLRSNDNVYLPRYGTDVLVKDETYPGDEKLLYTLHWRGGRFVKRIPPLLFARL